MCSGLAALGQLLLGVAIFASVLCYVVAYLEARRFLGRRTRATMPGNPVGPLPPVTLLKPLNGADADLHANLASFCAQAYPTFQIVFGVADSTDPAVGVVRRLQREFPAVDIELVIDAGTYGPNLKVSNLHNIYARAKHDIVLVADSDIRVAPHYLRRIAAEFDDPGVGLTTCLYRGVVRGGLPAVVEALCVNTDFVPMVMLARVVERPSYAFGSTIAMRRAVLDASGGFLPLVNYLADDYHLGNRIVTQGHRLTVSAMLVDTVMNTETWRAVLVHQVRWARTQRVCRPLGYFGSVLTHGTLWASVNLVCHRFSAGALALALLIFALRTLTAKGICQRYVGVNLRAEETLLVLIKDLFTSAIWLSAFLGSTVRWGGRRLRIMKDGRMVEVAPLVTAEARVRPQP